MMSPIAPAEPPAPWIGGKRHLAQRICRILAASPHEAYVEPFIGMGGVFLRRAQRPRAEVINDVAGDVVNLFRVLQCHPEALLRELRWRPAMRVEFDRLKGARVQDLTDIERAARFLYLQHLAYAGKTQHRSFGVDTARAHAFNLGRLTPRLERAHQRLGDVVIENLDWADLLPRYDRPGTLFYLDPPYWGSEGDYGPGVFGREDFEQLAGALAALEGRFLLSINDTPEVRALFAWADIAEVTTVYTIGREDRAAEIPELLIGHGVQLQAVDPQARLI